MHVVKSSQNSIAYARGPTEHFAILVAQRSLIDDSVLYDTFLLAEFHPLAPVLNQPVNFPFIVKDTRKRDIIRFMQM